MFGFSLFGNADLIMFGEFLPELLEPFPSNLNLFGNVIVPIGEQSTYDELFSKCNKIMFYFFKYHFISISY